MVAPDVQIEDGKGTILISSEEGETEGMRQSQNIIILSQRRSVEDCILHSIVKGLHLKYLYCLNNIMTFFRIVEMYVFL